MFDTRSFALWFIPAHPWRTDLADLIRDLAERHHATAFPPHVTLFSGSFSNPEPLMKIVAEVVKDRPPFALDVSGLAVSEPLFKSFYVDLAHNPTLIDLVDELTDTDPQSDYELNAHLSLLYKQMDQSQKQALLDQEIDLPEDLVFDEVWLADPGPDQPDWRDIQAWRVLRKFPLTGRIERNGKLRLV
jgi:putative hydrolase of the HAD superfamily